LIFLWGYCKEEIYKILPENIDDLDTRLRYAIICDMLLVIKEDVMNNVQENLLKRMKACVRMDGGHIEHLL